MASFDITDLISTGIESGVRQNQFNRDLTQRQLASEQLAKYRNDELVLRAEQAAENRRAAKAAEDYNTGQAAQRVKEFEADTVDGKTSRAAGVMDERSKPKTKVRMNGEDVMLDAGEVWRGQQNEKVAKIQMQGSAAQEKPFDFDRINYNDLSDSELSGWEEEIGRHRQQAMDPFTNIPIKGEYTYPQWAQQQLTRIRVAKARRAANLRGGTRAVTDTPSPFMVGPYTGKPTAVGGERKGGARQKMSPITRHPSTGQPMLTISVRGERRRPTPLDVGTYTGRAATENERYLDWVAKYGTR